MGNTDDDVALRTIKSACRFLGCSHTHLYDLRDQGLIEIVKIGRRGSRVTQVSLDKYLASVERTKPRKHPTLLKEEQNDNGG